MMTDIGEKDKPTSSLEDYLEAIVMLKEQGEKATVTALSQSLGVKKPSVDWALRKLGDAGLIIHEKYGDIELTPEGARIADEVYHHHKIIRQFLVEILNVDPETADNDACRMEHVLSKESLSRMEKFINFVLDCYPGLTDWEDIFNRYIEKGKDDREIQARFSKET
jgi:DtxR family Mn-dependent transcriptional regulator